MNLEIIQAAPHQAAIVSSILGEASTWTRSIGQPLWTPDEISVEAVAADVEVGLVHLALADGIPVGTIRFQLLDLPFWPEVAGSDSAFVHRLAVRRAYSGTGVASALLAWAENRARSLGRRYLRLDCEVGRPRLRAFYESHGFRHHSDVQAGPFHVSRFERDLAQLTGTHGGVRIEGQTS